MQHVHHRWSIWVFQHKYKPINLKNIFQTHSDNLQVMGDTAGV